MGETRLCAWKIKDVTSQKRGAFHAKIRSYNKKLFFDVK